MPTTGAYRQGESSFLLAPLQPTRGGPLLLPGHSTVPITVQQFTERTRALLAECASLLTAQGTEGPPPDIDVTSALIPTLPQAIAAAIAQVDETFDAAGLIAKSGDTAKLLRVRSTHATPTGRCASLKGPRRAIGKRKRSHSKTSPRQGGRQAEDSDHDPDASAAAAAATTAVDAAAQTSDSALGERGEAGTSNADGGVVMTLDDLLSSTRTDVINRLRPHEPWVVARAGAAAAVRADLESRSQRGDEQLHFLRTLVEVQKKVGRAREPTQSSLKPVLNYVTRPMQDPLYQNRLMAAPGSVPELRDEMHWREVYAEEGLPPAQSQDVTMATDGEVLLRVEVYHAGRPQTRMQEFMVLGSQSVSELMDRVYCLLDVDTAQPDGVRRHGPLPPRFVYLDGVFYSDVCGDGSVAAPILRHAAILRKEAAEAAEAAKATEASKQVVLTASQAREAALAAANANQRGMTGVRPSDNVDGSGGDDGEDALRSTPTSLAQPTSADPAFPSADTAPQGAVPVPVHPATVGAASLREKSEHHAGSSSQTKSTLPRGWRPEDTGLTADVVRGEAPLAGLLFSQLTTSVGATAVFCHHGCCEHKLLIKDVRLPHATDVRARKHYPLMVLSGKWQMGTDRKCQVCDTFFAKIATRGGRLAATSPAFYCDDCFVLAHGAPAAQSLPPAHATQQPPSDTNAIAPAPPTFTAASGLRTLESFPYYHD